MDLLLAHLDDFPFPGMPDPAGARNRHFRRRCLDIDRVQLHGNKVAQVTGIADGQAGGQVHFDGYQGFQS